MATITIKGIPDEIYGLLKANAAAHRRSINHEAIWCLERALTSGVIDPDEFLVKADAMRKRLNLRPLTEKKLKSAKAMGRP